MAHKSAVSMCLNRAGRAIVLNLLSLQNAAVETFQSLGSSIDEHTGTRKAANRANGCDCDIAHCATYYFVIVKRLLIVLWYLIPKFEVIACENRFVNDVGSMARIGNVGRSRA